jgi:hypothetical protein
MFVVFMLLHILLCDKVLSSFISHVESRLVFKLVLNSNEFAISKKGLKIKRVSLFQNCFRPKPQIGSLPIRVARPNAATQPARPLQHVARTGPPRHLHPRDVVQKTELDGGTAVKIFPFDYLQRKLTDQLRIKMKIGKI